MRAPLVVPLLPRKGQARKHHVWVASSLRAYRCEGVNPWTGEPTRFARGHADIERGDRFLKKLWLVVRQKPSWYVTTRHCKACARAIETERDWVLPDK